MNESGDPDSDSGDINLDEFHGQLYSAGAMLSGLLIADGSDIVSTNLDGIPLVGPTVLVAFLAYFGTLLIGRFTRIYASRIEKGYKRLVSAFGCILPVSGDFDEYHIGWVLGIVFVILLFIESFVGVRSIAIFYMIILIAGAAYSYRSGETLEASKFFRNVLVISAFSAFSTLALVRLAPVFVEINETVGSIISGVFTIAAVLICLALLEVTRSRNSLFWFHVVAGISFPVVITALAVLLSLIL